MSTHKLFRNWKIWLLIICLVLAVVSLHPNPWAKGVAIRSVIRDSAASDAGFQSPSPTLSPMSREVILSINNIPINNLEDYSKFVLTLQPNRTLTIKTTKDLYRLTTKAEYEIIVLGETELIDYTESVFDEELNQTINITKQKIVNKTLQKEIGLEDLGLKVYNAPTTNIRKGLDLQGGTRVMLKPEEVMSQEDIDTLIENMKERLNVYGLSDIVIRTTSDLSGQKFILVEIAGASDEEVKDLLAKQGKFEGKIANQSVFKGGQDILHVCRTADCSGIDTRNGCNQVNDQHYCRFRFAITLSPEAADRQAELTKNLGVEIENGEGYLTENLDLYLDDELVDSLRIGEELKGRALTDISISGSGSGATQQEAMYDALNNMKKLQTVLVTGSLPVKLTIVKTDNISPVLGNEFIRNTLLVGFVALLVVVFIVMLRYRRLLVSVPVIITLVSELVILLGVAALIGWNLDLVAIAGIIVAIGTGVDAQLVIVDETLAKHKNVSHASSWKDKLNNAFFIIMACYFTLVVAMLPLWFAGAGLLKGFALTTVLGISIGVFITRPAFAVISEVLLKHSNDEE